MIEPERREVGRRVLRPFLRRVEDGAADADDRGVDGADCGAGRDDEGEMLQPVASRVKPR